MKRKLIFLLALITLSAALFGGGGDSSRPRVLRLADALPLGHPRVEAALAFAKYVEEESNGMLKIDVFPSAALGQEREALEMVQAGSIDMITIGVNPLSSINPIVNAFLMPFLFRDYNHLHNVLDGPIGQEMAEAMQRQGLLGLVWIDSGFRSVYNSRREIKAPSDMAGMRIRVQESAIMMDMIRHLGASPTPMALGEVFTGIQNGIVDGAENNMAAYVTMAHLEVARYFTRHNLFSAPEMYMISTRTWNGLNDDQKRILKESAVKAQKIQRELWYEFEKLYEEQAVTAGTIITEITPAERQLWQAALEPMYQLPAYTQFSGIIRRVRETP